MLAILCLLVGALGLVVGVALFSLKAALVVGSLLVLAVGVDLGRTRPTMAPRVEREP